jgi:fructokinase
MAIAALGESLIDFTPVIEGARTTAFQPHPGGSPYNVAVAIARLGHPSAFAGRVSSDFFGRMLLDHLRANGVDAGRVRTGPEPTTLAFVAIEDGEPSFSFRAEGAADTLIAPADLDPAAFLDLEALHIGSISLTYEPSATSILGLVRSLRGRVPISFDPNVRTSLIRDEATYRSRVRELLAWSDVVKVSERDRRELGSFDPAALVNVESGPAAVVVTDGANGSTLYRRGSAISMPAAPSRVVDTVGAGDAFMAGLLVGAAERGGLDRRALRGLGDDAWREVLRLASTTAAMTCERAGAEPPTRAAVEERLSATRVSS